MGITRIPTESTPLECGKIQHVEKLNISGESPSGQLAASAQVVF